MCVIMPDINLIIAIPQWRKEGNLMLIAKADRTNREILICSTFIFREK